MEEIDIFTSVLGCCCSVSFSVPFVVVSSTSAVVVVFSIMNYFNLILFFMVAMTMNLNWFTVNNFTYV